MDELNMTMEELLALPVSVDILTAARAFGVGRFKAYELAKAGKFPCRVIQVGPKYRVPRGAIFEALGIDPDAAATRPGRPSPKRRPAPSRRPSSPRSAGAEAGLDPSPAA
jgi:hypothetical protein